MFRTLLFTASLVSWSYAFRSAERFALIDDHEVDADGKGTVCLNYCAADFHGWTQKCKWEYKCNGCPSCTSPWLEPVGVSLEVNQCLCCDGWKMQESQADSETNILNYCLLVKNFTAPFTKAHCAETCLHNSASPSDLQKGYILSKFIEGQNCLGANSRIDDKASGVIKAFQRGVNKVKKRLGDVASCTENNAYIRSVVAMKKALKTMATAWEHKGGDETEPKLYGGKDKDKPFKHCQGFCKSDSDCKTGLKCFQREGFEQVTTCRGRGKKDWWYCYKPDPSKVQATTAEVQQVCQDNDEGVKVYLETFGKFVEDCKDAKANKYCLDATNGEEVRRQCGITCGCPEGSVKLTGSTGGSADGGSNPIRGEASTGNLARQTSSQGSFTDDKLIRYLSDYDESVYPLIEAKVHHLIVRVDGQRRLHTPFEHICGGNEFEVSPIRGSDGPSEWISFTNAGQYPSFGEDCFSAFDRGSRRVTVSKLEIWKQKGITIDMSSRSKAWKWCYEGGHVTIFNSTIKLKGAKSIKPWPYKCAKSVFHRIHKIKEGSPNSTFWTKKNRRSIAKRCVDWATGAKEVLVLPDPGLINANGAGGSFNLGKKNRLVVKSDRDPIDRKKQCYFSETDRCVSLDSQKKTVCCCSQDCTNISCPLVVGQ